MQEFYCALVYSAAKIPESEDSLTQWKAAQQEILGPVSKEKRK